MAETLLRSLPPRARFNLRCPVELLPALAGAFGVLPSTVALRSAVAGRRAALWLGPDEWLLLAEEGAPAPCVPGASLVDVSHGSLGFALEGPGGMMALNEGCPLDLEEATFPIGACSRTLFGKTGILLWRRGASAFEIEVARSVAAPLRSLLEGALRDLDPPS